MPAPSSYGPGKATSDLKEGPQVGVELVLVRVRVAVGRPRVDLQCRVLDQPGSGQRVDGENQNQSRLEGRC